MLSNFKVEKIRSPKHRKFVAGLPCLVCRKHGRTQAAHIRSGNNAGMGVKSGDDCIVPLCCECHAGQNHNRSERQFWEQYGGIEKATNIAKSLYAVTGDVIEAMKIISRF